MKRLLVLVLAAMMTFSASAATIAFVNAIVDGAPTQIPVYVERQKQYTVVNVATDSTTVSSTPAMLYSVHVNTALSAHALPIMDGSATVFSFAASAAVGTNLVTAGIPCLTSLIVDPDNAGTGSVTVVWAPL